MAKFLLVSSLAIIVYMYFNYPIYSETVSFFIYVICLIVIVLSGYYVYYGKRFKNEEYNSVELDKGRLHANDGKFKYSSKGFSFRTKDNFEEVHWDEIVSINSLSIPLFDKSRQSHF